MLGVGSGAAVASLVVFGVPALIGVGAIGPVAGGWFAGAQAAGYVTAGSTLASV